LDAHVGLKQAIDTVLSGATWQRCRVHFMRNLLATVAAGRARADRSDRLGAGVAADSTGDSGVDCVS
jgi:transposase-like protein